jgi:hypothetical protein
MAKLALQASEHDKFAAHQRLLNPPVERNLYITGSLQHEWSLFVYTAIAEFKRCPGLPKDSLISRLTLRFASRQMLFK